ncbi:MAG: glutamate formimidoyltransferase [Myxococcota bacterium]|nr:glutamate formimidoyltransferase [Myxococcota bacterium]
MKLVECVPNFSEGRDRRVIDAIRDAIAAVAGVSVLDVDPGADTNRTVLTFVAAPEVAVEAAFCGIKKAQELIDMRRHHGAHPRHGATDVCPFVPVSDMTMEECAELARQLGRRVGEELGIPVYLYESAASRPERRNLAYVRQGEYEALAKKLAQPEWEPDFGPARFDDAIAKSGVTTIGARDFLIAYNVNLNTRDVRFANELAFAIREKGRSMRRGNTEPHYFRGDIVRYQPSKGIFPCALCEQVLSSAEALQAHCLEAHGFDWRAFLAVWEQREDKLEGQPVKQPGIFEHCKAGGWVIKDYGRAQITINLTKPTQTPPHLVLEACRKLAAANGTVVTGSEVVGLIPFEVLYAAGCYYLERYGGSAGLPWRDVLELAVRSMGLDDVSPFEIEKKVIGLPERPEACLMALSSRDFVDEVSRESPAPGGGSVAALCGSLGAALAAMVANLSVGKEGYEVVSPALDAVARRAQVVKEKLVRAVDTDTEAFNAVLTAMRLPKGSAEEKARREAAIQEGYKSASAVPLETARLCLEAIGLAKAVVVDGNKPSITDGGVAALVACAGVEGAVYNVRINLPSIRDEAFKASLNQELEGLVQQARALRDEVDALVRASFAG